MTWEANPGVDLARSEIRITSSIAGCFFFVVQPEQEEQDMTLDETQRNVILGKMRPLLEKRDWPKTICPSEVARALSREDLEQLNAEGWRDTMDDVREVVWELRANGEVAVMQKGEVLDDSVSLDDVHGPIRVRAKQK